MKYINIFFILSIIGHFIENFFYHHTDSGILYGYWTPLYGLGILIIIFINYKLKKIKLNKSIQPIYLFFICASTISLLELISGYIIEILFNKVFWDYSNMPLNIGKYTAISMSFIWGITSIIFIYILEPIINLISKKIPKYITYTLSILFLIDIIFTIINKTSILLLVF